MVPQVRDVSSLAATLARLRPFPAVVEAIRRAAANPATSVSDLVRFLEADVGVAADLMRVANAPTSALAQKCTSIRLAATLLGLRGVVELVTSAAALSYVEKSAGEFPQLGAHVLAVAGIARTLAPITGVPPDEAFTAGLLHDIGILLLVESEDPFYEGLIESLEGGEEPSIDDERALMGFEHATLGAAVAQEWNLPGHISQVIALHHDWEKALVAGGAVCAMVALLRVGDALVPVLRALSNPTLDQLTPLFDEPAFAHLGLTREELYRLWEPLSRACQKSGVVAVAPDAPRPIPRRPDIAPAPRVATLAPVEAHEPRLTLGMMLAAVLIVASALGVVLFAVQ